MTENQLANHYRAISVINTAIFLICVAIMAYWSIQYKGTTGIIIATLAFISLIIIVLSAQKAETASSYSS